MNNGFRVVIIGAAFAALAVSSTFFREGEEKGIELQCDWRPNLYAQYEVKVISVGELFAGIFGDVTPGIAQQVNVRYDANLEVKSQLEQGRDGLYSASLLSIRGMDKQSQKLRADLRKPFNFQMDTDCRISGFGFTADDSSESREIKKGLLVSMEVVTDRSKANLSSWRVEQTDSLGTFAADYHHDIDDGSITRKKIHYNHVTSLSPDVALSVEISQSEGRVTPRAEFWVERFTLREKLRVLTDAGQTFLRSETNVSLILKDPKNWMTSELSSPLAGLEWEGINVAHESRLENSHYNSAGVAVVSTLSAALENFSKGDFKGGKIDREAVAELVAFLMTHPETIPDLFNQIKSERLPKELHAFIFFAFEKTGTPEVQRALVAAIKDEEHSEMNRMRAMHALADVKTPIPESVEALIEASRSFSDTTIEDHSLASTALLALGVLEKQQADGSGSDLADLASEELVSRMQSRASAQERAVLAEALGNTGNPKYEELILDQFSDENAMVRVSSARGLASIGSPNADIALLDAVAKETNVDARKSIAEAWVMKDGERGKVDVTKLAAAISRESDEAIRTSLVVVLGREAAVQPAAKAALINQFHQEKSVAVKYKIGSYLKADELFLK